MTYEFTIGGRRRYPTFAEAEKAAIRRFKVEPWRNPLPTGTRHDIWLVSPTGNVPLAKICRDNRGIWTALTWEGGRFA